MTHAEEQENKEKSVVAGVEKSGLQTPDANFARTANADAIRTAQEANPNKHNGSAGGDQLESIQIVALDNAGQKQIIAERAKDFGKLKVTPEQLRARSLAGDELAISLVSDLERAEKLPAPSKDGQIARILKKAEPLFEVQTNPPSKSIREQSDLMDTGTLLALESQNNPAAEPVKLFREWVEKQPESASKEAFRKEIREQTKDLSPEMRARMEKLDGIRQQIDDAGLEEGGIHQAITPERAKILLEGRIEVEQKEAPTDWLSAGQRIAELPLDKQLQVIGAGLIAGLEQYQHDERERNWGAIIGTTEGLGAVMVNLATIAEFTCDVIAGNKKRAAERGEAFGKAIGETFVSGIKLFEKADNYLFNIGYTGDYSKPFSDLAAFGQALNHRWSELPPREQERIKYKLVTELAADGLIGAGGAKAIGKAKVFTEVLDAVALEAQGAKNAAKGIGKQVLSDVKGMSQDVREGGQNTIRYVQELVGGLTSPDMELAGVGKWKFKNEFKKPEVKNTHLAMSKVENIQGSGGAGYRGDHDVYALTNKSGLPKSYIDANGDLTPCDPRGLFKGEPVDVVHHLCGSFFKYHKKCSPYTSFSETGEIINKYGERYKITADLKSLEAAISSGEVKDVVIIPHKTVLKMIDESPCAEYSKRRARSYATADKEILIKGILPKRFFTVEDTRL